MIVALDGLIILTTTMYIENGVLIDQQADTTLLGFVENGRCVYIYGFPLSILIWSTDSKGAGGTYTPP